MTLSLQIEPWQVYTGLAITGTFIGLGNALGQWLFKEHILKRIKQIKNKIIKIKKTDTLQ